MELFKQQLDVQSSGVFDHEGEENEDVKVNT